jgi:aryl-alcohol dehydrogenase-like predicted oxidoreductase
LIGEAIRGRRHDVVIHSKSGSPRDGSPDAVRGGGDPRYLRQTCEQSLKNLGIETLDIFCMSRVDPDVPIEESVGGMAELVREGKTRFISLSECSAGSLRRGSAVHPLASLQMEYSLFSRDAEEQGQIDACKELGIAMMAYAVLGRGMLSAEVPKVEELAVDDVRAELPRFHSANIEKNLRLGSALGAIARRKNATLAQLSIAWTIAQGSRAGAFIVPIPGAKSRKHIEENVRAADIALTADDLAEIGSHRTARRRVRRPLSDRTNAPTEHLRLVGQEATQNDARTRVSLCGFPYNVSPSWRDAPRLRRHRRDDHPRRGSSER